MYASRFKSTCIFGFLFIAGCQIGCAELDLDVDKSPLSETDQNSAYDSNSSTDEQDSNTLPLDSDTLPQLSDSIGDSASDQTDPDIPNEKDNQPDAGTDDSETDDPAGSDEEPPTDSDSELATDTVFPMDTDTEHEGEDTEDSEFISETDPDTTISETDNFPSDTEPDEPDTVFEDSDTDIGSSATETEDTETEDTETEETETADTETEDTEIENTDTSPVTSGALVHRWGFNGTLADSVGGSDATIMSPVSGLDSSVSLTDSEAVMSGGQVGVTQWVSLGTGLITKIGGPVTIELFATLESISYFSRIFEFGGGRYEYILMTWCYEGDGNRDLVRWWDAEKVSVTDTNAPYALGQEYHIVVTIDPEGGTDGAMRITWYSELSSSSNIGSQKGSLETTDLLSDFNDTDLWLGKAHSDIDPVTHGRYNEVRIWSGALSESDISLLHELGPNM